MDLKQRIISKLKKPGYENHKWPITRRDFIRMGLISGAFHFSPLLGKANRAQAQVQEKKNIPFLVIDLEGGAALPGNFLVGQAGGPEDLLTNYSTLGWNPREANALDRTYGLPMSSSSSQILTGLNQAIPESVRSRFRFGSFLSFTRDDTAENVMSALSLVHKAFGGGEFLKSGLSYDIQLQTTIDAYSGGRSRTRLESQFSPPIRIKSPTFYSQLTELGTGDTETDAQLMKFLIENSNNPEMKNALKELEIFSSGLQFRYTDNPEVVAIYGNNNNSTEAALVYNCIKGNVGPSVITVGGCDYHDGGSQTGDNKDTQIGLTIGRAVATAAALNSPLFIQVITDGGMSSVESTRDWNSDSPTRSMSLVAYFDPNKTPEMKRQQVGHYLAAGEVDQETLVGNDLAKVIVGVAANYLNVSGRLGEFADLVGSRGLSNQELEQLLIF